MGPGAKAEAAAAIASTIDARSIAMFGVGWGAFLLWVFFFFPRKMLFFVFKTENGPIPGFVTTL
jgi:hypothetical protein